MCSSDLEAVGSLSVLSRSSLGEVEHHGLYEVCFLKDYKVQKTSSIYTPVKFVNQSHSVFR